MNKPILEMTMRDCLYTEKNLRDFSREIKRLCNKKKSSFFRTIKGIKFKCNALVHIPECSYIVYPTVNLHLLDDNKTVRCEIGYDLKDIESFTITNETDSEIYPMLAASYDKIEERYIALLDKLNIK